MIRTVGAGAVLGAAGGAYVMGYLGDGPAGTVVLGVAAALCLGLLLWRRRVRV